MLQNNIITILLMALVTYLVRASGYWLAGRIKLNPYLESWLNYLPGCIIISIVAPLVLQSEGKEWLGALVTILIMLKFNNLLLSMVTGMMVVVILRLVS